MRAMDLVVGIDIGGTSTTFGFVDDEGTLIFCETMPTHACDPPDDFVDRLKENVEAARKKITFDYRLKGIGIGAPNAHHDRGTLEKPPNLNWGETVNFTGLVRRRWDLPVAITNDANAAAIGEMLFGGARGMKHFIVITIGTGLGSGIVADGHLLYGATGFAGELGHTVYDPDGRLCACGKRGCLETYVSAPGLVKTAADLLGQSSNPSTLRQLASDEMTSRKIFEHAAAGDAVALTVFDQTARILGLKLADAVACVSPEAIFLAGGVALAGDLLVVPARRYMNDFLFCVYRGSVAVRPSELPAGKGAVLGAAALILSELKG